MEGNKEASRWRPGNGQKTRIEWQQRHRFLFLCVCVWCVSATDEVKPNPGFPFFHSDSRG